MSIKKRLDLIVRELGLSGRAFEKECGLTNGSYSSIRDGVGADKLNKIIFRYPQISAEWLISGNGEMMKTNVKTDKKGFDDGNFGSIFASDGIQPHTPLNREEMKTILFQMAGILSGHQHEISRLLTELELNGKRSDRLLDIIEHGFVRDDENPLKQDPAGHSPLSAIRAD